MSAESSFEPGNVVILKSGGQALTVVSSTAQGVQCIWIGEEGDLFSATLPAVTLEAFDMDIETDDEPEDDASDAEHHDGEHHEGEHHNGEHSERAA